MTAWAPGRGARKRIRAQHDARSKIDAALGGHREYDVEMVVDASKYPESARHIREAQGGLTHHGPDPVVPGSHPSVLTIDREGADEWRADSLAGIPTGRRTIETRTRPPCSRKAGPAPA